MACKNTNHNVLKPKPSFSDCLFCVTNKNPTYIFNILSNKTKNSSKRTGQTWTGHFCLENGFNEYSIIRIFADKSLQSNFMIWKPCLGLWFRFLPCFYYTTQSGFPSAFEEAQMVKSVYMWVGYAQGWRCESLKLTHQFVWAKYVLLEHCKDLKQRTD